MHRDVKPRNILILRRRPDDIFIKFTDFGISREGDTLKTFCGTYAYLAPEVYEGKSITRRRRPTYTALVDVWSLGVVLARLLCGLPKQEEIDENMGVEWGASTPTAITGYGGLTPEQVEEKRSLWNSMGISKEKQAENRPQLGEQIAKRNRLFFISPLSLTEWPVYLPRRNISIVGFLLFIIITTIANHILIVVIITILPFIAVNLATLAEPFLEVSYQICCRSAEKGQFVLRFIVFR